MERLGRLGVRHRWWMLTAWIVTFVVVTALSRSVGSSYANSFSLPRTNSAHAHQLLSRVTSERGDTDEIVFAARGGTVAAHRAAITAMLDRVAALPQVAGVTSPFCASAAPCPGTAQVSRDGTIAYALVHFTLPGYQLALTQIRAVEQVGATARSPSLEVQFGGNAFGQLDSPVSSPGELIGILVAAVILFVAFGSLLAMLLPLGIALFALGIASGVSALLSHVLTIAQFAPILGSLIGLGVGIDYALFIVTRTRQGLQRGLGVEDAVATAINTAGRAVVFAGATVAIALLGMLVLRLSFLNGVAVAATTTVVITMLASITLLPALLAFVGFRVLSRRQRRALAAHGPAPVVVAGPWQRWAHFVARHPVVLSSAAVVAIAVLAIPFFSLRLGSSDQGSNPPSTTTRQAYDLLSTGFGPGFTGPLTIVGRVRTSADRAAMAHLAAAVTHVPDVASASPAVALAHGSIEVISVVPASSPQSQATTTLIDTLRQRTIPRAAFSSHTAIYVGGLTAIYDDFATVLGSKLPLFVGVIVLLGSLLLMVAFRSVVVPVIAAVMNLLAVGASFGVVVAVFQWGWGSRLLNAGTGPVESFLPIIMVAILFGLSMDYQVFLVSRMHEEWLNTKVNEEAVVRGQATTGRVITAAALIMISVFLSFAFGGQRIIAEFGVGLGGAVLLDAFILRTVLVPALMHFLGRANWYMPAWLERIVPHVAVEATEADLAFDGVPD
ncbi:MAG: MMPL family transporter [Acidimicrobiales bacterium]